MAFGQQKGKNYESVFLDIQLGQNKKILNVSVLQVGSEEANQIFMVLMGYARGLKERSPIGFWVITKCRIIELSVYFVTQ